MCTVQVTVEEFGPKMLFSNFPHIRLSSHLMPKYYRPNFTKGVYGLLTIQFHGKMGYFFVMACTLDFPRSPCAPCFLPAHPWVSSMDPGFSPRTLESPQCTLDSPRAPWSLLNVPWILPTHPGFSLRTLVSPCTPWFLLAHPGFSSMYPGFSPRTLVSPCAPWILSPDLCATECRFRGHPCSLYAPNFKCCYFRNLLKPLAFQHHK
jgi:hypothetical protein